MQMGLSQTQNKFIDHIKNIIDKKKDTRPLAKENVPIRNEYNTSLPRKHVHDTHEIFSAGKIDPLNLQKTNRSARIEAS